MYAGLALVTSGPTSRKAKPWLDSGDEDSSTDEELRAFVEGRQPKTPAAAPAPAPPMTPESQPPTPDAFRRHLDDDVLQRFLDGDDAAGAVAPPQIDDEDSDDGDEDPHALFEGERRHKDAFRRAASKRERREDAAGYRPASVNASPRFDDRGRAHFGVDVDEWRERLEGLQKAVGADDDGDAYLPRPPELEYARYMIKRGRFGEAGGTLRRLLAKQKADFKRENALAALGPTKRELRMHESQRHKLKRPNRRSTDALAVLCSRTERVLADLEEARARPHVALFLRKRSLATHLRVIGPGDGSVSMENRDLEKAVAEIAALLKELGNEGLAAGLYCRGADEFRGDASPAAFDSERRRGLGRG